ncbi:nose resistant to fluoxetine protein 6-like [Ptychodera flava]|uniref:nose resistant to fluoxetine protein 6-like n=1 Tax=Ptychodera flava TaxID=63121 RepID=UPI00396A6DBC
MAKFVILMGCAVVAATMLPSVTGSTNMMEIFFPEFQKSFAPGVDHPYHDVTEKCYADTVKYMVDYYPTFRPYAREMYYSCGEIRDDYDLTWNLNDPGNFGMCRQVKPGNETTFETVYCYTTTYISETGDAINKGVCFPDSCTEKDVEIFIKEAALTVPGIPGWAFTVASCAKDSHEFRWSDILATTLCAILAVVLIVGTTYDIVQRRRTELKKMAEAELTTFVKTTPSDGDIVGESVDAPSHNINGTTVNVSSQERLDVEQSATSMQGQTKTSKCKEFLRKSLMAFSVIDAGKNILSTSQGSRNIGCLNGIRVLSMFWIILYHHWIFLGSSTPIIDNPRYVHEVVGERFASQVLRTGDLGVEAFLVLSGLLVAYLTLKQIDKRGGPRRYNWLLFYVHRYWRLTPVYAFCLMIYSTLTLHMGNGVWWNNWYGAQQICQDRWWANIFYFHNLYPFPGSVSECMGWTWYLSVDMQLFIVSPIFIILFYKSWVGGIVLSVITTLISLASTAYIEYIRGTPMRGGGEPYRESELEPGSWLYTKPYYRIPQYLVGIALGYMFFKLKGKQIKINKIVNCLLWCCAVAIALAVVYGPYSSDDSYRVPQWAAVMYLTLFRFAMSLCIAWVIFACATGNGGPVNSLLSWSGWLPLAKMNYCAYLLHLVVLFLYTWGFETLWHYTDFHFGLEFLGLLAVTYSLSFLVATTVEIPFLNFEKVVIPSRR